MCSKPTFIPLSILFALLTVSLNVFAMASEKNKVEENKYYTVTGRLEAIIGKESQLKENLMALIKPTLQEEGCIDYKLYQSPDDPRQFMFYENWASKEAFKRHGQTSHIKAWEAIKDDLLASANEVTCWEIVEVKG